MKKINSKGLQLTSCILLALLFSVLPIIRNIPFGVNQALMMIIGYFFAYCTLYFCGMKDSRGSTIMNFMILPGKPLIALCIIEYGTAQNVQYTYTGTRVYAYCISIMIVLLIALFYKWRNRVPLSWN